MTRLLPLLTLLVPMLGGCLAEKPMALSEGMIQPTANVISSETKAGLVLTKEYPARPKHTEEATFSAGCFWGVEDAFRTAPGVVATMVGYTGGHVKNPTYEEVCTHTTGHAESVLVEFDTDKTSYAKMLDLFFSIHDPASLNQQGPDVGDNYRSAVFYHSPTQKGLIEVAIEKLQSSPEFKGEKIVTDVEPAKPFYRAEEYHQQYVEKGGVAECHPRKKN